MVFSHLLFVIVEYRVVAYEHGFLVSWENFCVT